MLLAMKTSMVPNALNLSLFVLVFLNLTSARCLESLLDSVEHMACAHDRRLAKHELLNLVLQSAAHNVLNSIHIWCFFILLFIFSILRYLYVICTLFVLDIEERQDSLVLFCQAGNCKMQSSTFSEMWYLLYRYLIYNSLPCLLHTLTSIFCLCLLFTHAFFAVSWTLYILLPSHCTYPVWGWANCPSLLLIALMQHGNSS